MKKEKEKEVESAVPSGKLDNPFSLLHKEDEKAEFEKAEAEFILLWKNFVDDWHRVRRKYSNLGASDTAARDAQRAWVREQLRSGSWSI